MIPSIEFGVGLTTNSFIFPSTHDYGMSHIVHRVQVDLLHHETHGEYSECAAPMV